MTPRQVAFMLNIHYCFLDGDLPEQTIAAKLIAGAIAASHVTMEACQS